ncbi:hypothetical protein H257_15746 [Aphanomyces astaci]|uniref:Uncharacterized protein n=1 Tax=Aphanomyces astaci TaxID=112090 RepID=W4FN87_APHAT|nr:hypothetical protein H257_15746 [Aphanomyces astaci]ETV68304.1 hypothetical protein H257_15746 [Aphanomyces astaci]|eukprot:XP_009842247.1 hypothetical protein H257_15746 [Aphanomyces astaci]
MKLFAALVHAAAAASQVEVDKLAVVFDSLAPIDAGAKGSPISKGKSVAVQFPTFPASDLECFDAAVTLEYVNFTVNTLNIATDESLWLQAELCPSANGLPHCTKSDTPERIPIQTFDEQVKFQWYPPPNFVLDPATTYWFTVHSNGETKDKLPIWLDGAKTFSTANDPRKEVLVAYTESEGGNWGVAFPVENRLVPSLQVYSS